MNDGYQWLIIISMASMALSVITILTRSFDKNLSIREHDAWRGAVENDIKRVENRLLDIERSRPTTGELQIVADSLGKRIDHLRETRS